MLAIIYVYNNSILPTHEFFEITTIFPRLIPLGYYYFHVYNPNVLYLNNATVRYYSRVHYYFYAYKQLCVISFLFFDNIAIVSRMILLFTASNNVT